MAYKIMSGAVQADADICNLVTVDAPKRGIHIGPGLHIAIPADWLSRCVAGQQVPGCNYASVNALDSTMVVSQEAEANQAIPANVVGVNATVLLNFRTKLLTAILAGGFVVG